MEEIEAIVKRISEVDPTVVSSNAKCKEIVDKIQRVTYNVHFKEEVIIKKYILLLKDISVFIHQFTTKSDFMQTLMSNDDLSQFNAFLNQLDNFCFIKEENLILSNKDNEQDKSDVQLVIKDNADSENVEQDCSFSDNTVLNHLNKKAVNLEEFSRRSSDDVDRMIGASKTIDISKSNEVEEDCDSIAWTTDNFEEYIERLGEMIKGRWRSENDIKNLTALKKALEEGKYRDQQGKLIMIAEGVIDETHFYRRPEDAMCNARPHCMLFPIPRDDDNPTRLHVNPYRMSSIYSPRGPRVELEITVKQRRVDKFETIIQSAAQLGSNVAAQASAIGRCVLGALGVFGSISRANSNKN